MIVKLTYSAELDDVPSEVGKIMETTVSEMETLVQDLDTVAGNLTRAEPDVQTGLSKVKFALKFVEKLETRLKDCESILSGYANVIEQQKEQEKQKQAEVPVEAPKVEEVEESKQRGTKKKAG